ncbi:MAG: pyridoxal-phosphate dependent enzyme [Betaproteobacteria bacterium]|nr:pyridoxal-phosphate dependent enzyme [Betaproteobacteria bacterium]
MTETGPAVKLPEHVVGLRCLVCGKLYPSGRVGYVCPHHGDEGILDVVYDYARIRANIERNPHRLDGAGMWRYSALLPLRDNTCLPLPHVGATPLYDVPGLAGALGLQRLWVKDEGRQPTGSLKDRASALAVAMALSAGFDTITTASTGNAAAALAGMSAGLGMKPVIFVPASILPAKIAQLRVFGAITVLVDGSYDQAFDLCLEASRYFGWYNRSTGFNPYMTEGKKTVVYEIMEQVAQAGDVVDSIIVGAGDGCILGAVHKGLQDMLALGWIEQMPKLFGVQAEGSDYLYQAWKTGADVYTAPPIHTHGIADSLMAGLPQDRLKAMAAVRSTGGAFIRVSDDEILEAIPTLARGSGVFAEPAAAAAYAGLVCAVASGQIEQGERVALISTGSGLKDIASAIASVDRESQALLRCSPDLSSLQNVWQGTFVV